MANDCPLGELSGTPIVSSKSAAACASLVPAWNVAAREVPHAGPTPVVGALCHKHRVAPAHGNGDFSHLLHDGGWRYRRDRGLQDPQASCLAVDGDRARASAAGRGVHAGAAPSSMSAWLKIAHAPRRQQRLGNAPQPGLRPRPGISVSPTSLHEGAACRSKDGTRRSNACERIDIDGIASQAGQRGQDFRIIGQVGVTHGDELAGRDAGRERTVVRRALPTGAARRPRRRRRGRAGRERFQESVEVADHGGGCLLPRASPR